MGKLDWKKLICTDRFSTGGPKPISIPSHPVSAMQNDVSAILSSSAFRRMQRKAQVYIAPDTDFVRNRLTHTLEVAEIARTLAGLIFVELDPASPSMVVGEQKKFADQKFKDALNEHSVRKRDLTEAIAAAAYMHDIGNPPFGHVGEYAITSWFRDYGSRDANDAPAFLKLARFC